MSQNRTIQLHPDWLIPLENEFNQPYMQQLSAFLQSEKRQGKTIYPPGPLIFNALNSTPPDQVKLVILGQDPYHGPGQAHGLSFSVPQNIAKPPSLVNIFKEIQADLGLTIPAHGNLQSWADQGVLLLNTVLTVESGKAASHQGQGWEQFTDAIIQYLNQSNQARAFLLWGSHAQKKGQILDKDKHLILQCPHPSPLSAHRGFFGCKHFSKANQWLIEQHQTPIDWTLP